MQDVKGDLTTIEVPCYHIPKAEVRLLSPQVLLGQAGGELIQTSADVCLCLSNDLVLIANYYSRSRLPLLHLSDGFICKSFWADASAYSNSEVRDADNLLQGSNANLSASQQEVLLWHYCLSHA